MKMYSVSFLLSFLLILSFNQGVFSRDLVFFDDFNGTSINTTLWNVGNGCDAINQESQCYTNDTSVVFIKNGSLIIKPKWGTTCQGNKCYEALSGKLTTWGTYFGNTGRYEIRAKLPTGNYTWPALWLLVGM